MKNSKNNNNYTNTEPSKLRGKSAIEMLHKSISKEDEKMMNLKISDIYQVDLEEAKEIHTNYHSHRICSLLLDRSKKHGMTESTFVDKIKCLDFQEYAYQVSIGELIEMAAVDLLYKGLCDAQTDDAGRRREDRYINFYG